MKEYSLVTDTVGVERIHKIFLTGLIDAESRFKDPFLRLTRESSVSI